MAAAGEPGEAGQSRPWGRPPGAQGPGWGPAWELPLPRPCSGARGAQHGTGSQLGVLPRNGLRLASRPLCTEAPAPLGDKPTGQAPPSAPSLLHRAPPPQTKPQLPLLRHFCTRHGTLTRTTCGLAHAPSPLLFMRQAEAGGDPETGGGGEAGAGANVCFQYVANRGLFPLFRIILYWVDVFRA